MLCWRLILSPFSLQEVVHLARVCHGWRWWVNKLVKPQLTCWLETSGAKSNLQRLLLAYAHYWSGQLEAEEWQAIGCHLFPNTSLRVILTSQHLHFLVPLVEGDDASDPLESAGATDSMSPYAFLKKPYPRKFDWRPDGIFEQMFQLRMPMPLQVRVVYVVAKLCREHDREAILSWLAFMGCPFAMLSALTAELDALPLWRLGASWGCLAPKGEPLRPRCIGWVDLAALRQIDERFGLGLEYRLLAAIEKEPLLMQALLGQPDFVLANQLLAWWPQFG